MNARVPPRVIRGQEVEQPQDTLARVAFIVAAQHLQAVRPLRHPGPFARPLREDACSSENLAQGESHHVV